MTSQTKSSNFDKEADVFGIEIGDFCVYRNHLIGVVVITNPLTIINVTDTNFKSNMTNSGAFYNKILNLFFPPYCSYSSARKFARNYKTSGTKHGQWHLPTIEELEIIGFTDVDTDPELYQHSANFPHNSKCEKWETTINNSLNMLPRPFPLTDKDGSTIFWGDLERPYLYQNGQTYKTSIASVWDCYQIYRNRPNSKYLIYRNITLFPDENNRHTLRSVRYFHTIPNHKKSRYQFIRPDALLTRCPNIFQNF